MRQHNKYLVKVQEELSVYQRYLLNDGVELTPTQFDTFEKIDTVRAWLREGYSDQQVLSMLKNGRSIQDRRGREILALSYAIFAELRRARDKDGVKYLYAEMFKAAAKEAKDAGDLVSFGILLEKAAKIDGAYDKQEAIDQEQKKKPQKVVIKVKTMNVLPAPEQARTVIDTTHELGE
ncbi:hypothetical protein [uncultured Fibrella sp.]|uniref:hypothetical protein n=1 Tax=uncultured Fibrella sp. TaxID=1284596 RepID=UPI0035CBBB3D